MTPIDTATATSVLHIAIDLQRLFAEPGDWHAPALNDIVPAVARLTEHRPSATVFTRFITPYSADASEVHGRWQHYYRHWQSVTLQHLPTEQLELVKPLTRFTPPAAVIDKTTHGAFESPAFVELLAQQQPETLIFSGVETDVCVLASVLSAIDRGYRVIVASDAVASSCVAGHQATLDILLPRYDQQVEVATVAAICQAWR